MLHGGDGGVGGCVAAWRSSRDGKQRPGNGNRYRFRARQIGLNNVAQTHSTSRSHPHGRRNGEATRMQAAAAEMLSCVTQSCRGEKESSRKLQTCR